MKKTLLFLPMMAALGIVSCTSNNESEISLQFYSPTVNIVSNLQTGETTASKGNYQFALSYAGTNGTGQIGSGDFLLGSSNMTLTTVKAPFTSNGYLGSALFKNIEGTVSSNVSYALDNSQFYTTPFYNFLDSKAGDYTYQPKYLSTGMGNTFLPVVIASFQLGDEYLVKTFQQDTFFTGTSTTRYDQNGVPVYNTSDEITYRIHLNDDLSTAVLIIYNARFSGNPNEPLKEAIIAEGLDVTYSADGITISGQDIEPFVVEGSSVTPYPNYVFNSITFKSIGTYFLNCKIDYEVAGMYYGSFQGSYLYDTYFK